MKIICPFCKAELDSKDDQPEIAERVNGPDYVCHKVICYNKEKHPDKNILTIVFQEEE